MFEVAMNKEYTLSAQLEKSTSKIWKLSEDMNSNAFGIAYHIADVNATGAYSEDFKTVHEWTNAVFGIKKSMSYNMLTIGNGFVQCIKQKGKPARYTSIFFDPETMETDFTISQIIAMIPFCKTESDIEKVKELIANGEIGTDFTVKQLKEALEDAFADEFESGESETETEDNTEYITVKTESGEYKIPVDKFDKYAIPVN